MRGAFSPAIPIKPLGWTGIALAKAIAGAGIDEIEPQERGGKGGVVEVQEVRKVESYMKRLFGNAKLRVVPRPKKDDSAEVFLGEEFIGVLFVDDEDDERCYNFQMAILAADLE
jgi:hypothetical protein